jgi:hypothetical protein
MDLTVSIPRGFNILRKSWLILVLFLGRLERINQAVENSFSTAWSAVWANTARDLDGLRPTNCAIPDTICGVDGWLPMPHRPIYQA